MPFVIPDFNLNVAFWRNANWPANPPDVITIGNLSPGKIVAGDVLEDAAFVPGPFAGPLMWLRLPKGTDCQDVRNNGLADVCECPYQSGRFYWVTGVDDIGGGFANEHRFALLAPMRNWPLPFPPVGGFTPIIVPFPPTFYSDGSSLPGGGINMTLSVPNLGGSIGGCVCMINSGLTPTVSVNGGPNCLLSGGGYSISVFPPGMPSMSIYPYIDVGVVGINSVFINTGSLVPVLFICNAGSGFGTGTALTVETSLGAFIGPPALPAYAPNPAHPKVHMVYSCMQNPFGALGWSMPFFTWDNHAPYSDGLHTYSLLCGVYPAHAGGQFPAQATGAGGAYVAIQNSYVP